jgi:hypothetical protein
MGFEENIADLNELFFFREFTFSKNTFRPEPQAEVEFADNVIWLDDLAILYQLKERNASTTTFPEREKKWFANDVLGKATRQIRNTLKYLDECAQIQLQNGRGHTFNLATASLRTREKVVIYLPHDLLPNDCRRIKHHQSTSAGLIHIFQAADYLGVCQTLITPHEIHDYLQYRESLINRWGDKVLDMPEPVLVGHYLNGDSEQVPELSHAKYFHSLEENRKDWDLSDVIGKFADRIFASNTPTEYYRIIAEISKLDRKDLFEFKKRLSLSLTKARDNQFTRPYRIVIPRTGCGFVFVPITKDLVPYQIQGLKNLTHAHKYDQKLSKCVGVSVAYGEDNYFSIYWCYADFPWQYDSAMDERLKENNPFRDMKTSESPRYTFKSTSNLA